MKVETTPIDGTENVLDSRDVIARVEYLEEQLEACYETEGSEGSFAKWLEVIANPDNKSEHPMYEEAIEHAQLIALVGEAESSPDWEHGEQLICESYFTQYIEELIAQCYESPKEFRSGEWPYRHMTFDYEAAAQEAKDDYFEVTLFGSTYFIRA
jgi:hypothetical protein